MAIAGISNSAVATARITKSLKFEFVVSV